MMRISVIIPVHNEEKYLAKCLDSLTAQAFEGFEIICVDDGSTDNSLSVLEAFAEKDGRVRVIRIDKSGAAVARNVGIDAASGDYLALLDADDEYMPDMLEKLYGLITNEGSDVCICGSAHIDAESGGRVPDSGGLNPSRLPPSPFKPDKIADDIFMFSTGWAWDKLFSREFINRHGLRFQNIQNSNDAYFVFMALALADGVSYTADVLALHRNNLDRSLSSAQSRGENWTSMYMAIDALHSGLVERGKYGLYEKGFVRWTASFSKWYILTIEGAYRDLAIGCMKNTVIPKLYLDAYSEEYYGDLSDYYWIKALVLLPADGASCGEILVSFYGLIGNMCNELKFKNSELERAHSNIYYKIGRFLTWLPRKTVRFFIGWKRYGLKYVFIRIFKGKSRGEAYKARRRPRGHIKGE